MATSVRASKRSPSTRNASWPERWLLAGRLGAWLALLVLAGCAAPAGEPRSVTIERTAYGVAHITAPNYEALAFGSAYAHSQDNVCNTAQHLVTLRGERSQFFGPAATGVFGTRRLPNSQIDAFVRTHMDDAVLASAWTGASEEARAAVRGYVAGYNRYLQDTGPAGLPAECRGAAWVRAMTESDQRRVYEDSAIMLGLGPLAGAVLAAGPPAPGAAAESAAQSEPEAVRRALAQYGDDGGELGSNGWAFGRNATPDGAGVHLANPHFPWHGHNRFWQQHLTIPGRLDVMGAIPGGGGALVSFGFNRDVSWSHTVSTGRRHTLYELRLDPADPTTYLVDGQRRKMQRRQVSVPLGPGAAPMTYTTWHTQWGPVVVIPGAGLTWSAATAYAVADANVSNARQADTWMQMNRARSVQELRRAMENNGIPWLNTVAADRAGDALYADLSVVPDVPADMLRRCAPSPRAAALLPATVVLDGSRGDCAWQREPTAPVPGLTPASRMPVLVTADWVQNSNDSYWLANPAIPPGATFSPLVGPVAVPQRLRTRSGILEIQARLAGRDGLPGNKMGVEEVRQVILRNRNHAASLVLPDLLAACDSAAASLGAAQREGCLALAGWDRHNEVASAGAPLFREFWRMAKDIKGVWREPFDAARPVVTPSGLRMSDPAVQTAVFKALDDAVGILRKAGYPADVALGQVQFREVRGRRVPIHGGDEFEGVLNKVETQGQRQLAAGGYQVNAGSSYLQAVTFDARGPVAHALLTYGQAPGADAPHAFDQLPLFSAKQWVRLPFHRAEVDAQRVGVPLVLKY